MKKMKQLLAALLVTVMFCTMFAGCGEKKTDDSIYLTKGEFFAYIVHEENMSSDQYSVEEVNACRDGSVEADIIAEWGYLDEEQTKSGLDKPVTKEIVVTVCANATFNLKQGDVSKIKDADMLKNPQVIADACESGFCELENGYFDGAKKLTFAECEAIYEKSLEYTANSHLPENTLVVNKADDLIEYDGSKSSEEPIVVEVITDGENEEVSANEDESNTVGTAFDYRLDKGEGIQLLADDKEDAVPVAANTCCMVTIPKKVFEGEMNNPKPGDAVLFSNFKYAGSEKTSKDAILGELMSATLEGDHYRCTLQSPPFEKAVEKVDVEEFSGNKVEKLKQLKTEVAGWKIKCSAIGGGVKADISKTFDVNGKKVDAKMTYTVSNVNVETENLKAFVKKKKGSGYIKVTYNTSMSFDLSSGLRCGGFKGIGGGDAKKASGSKCGNTTVASFEASLYGIVGAEIGIYVEVGLDGQIHFSSNATGGGVVISANGGNVSMKKLPGKTDKSAELHVHAYGEIGIEAGITLCTFIDVIKYRLGVRADIDATISLYSKEEKKSSGVQAAEEDLNAQMTKDKDFHYCIDTQLVINLVGKLQDSGVKLITDALNVSWDFTIELYSAGWHFEDGSEVPECTRGKESDEDDVEESEEDEVELDTYKAVLNEGMSRAVNIKALPKNTLSLFNSKNAVTVTSDDEKVATACYHKNDAFVTINAVGEGSTEIVVTAKKGILWWKDTVEQKISVTVTTGEDGVTKTVYTVEELCDQKTPVAV